MNYKKAVGLIGLVLQADCTDSPAPAAQWVREDVARIATRSDVDQVVTSPDVPTTHTPINFGTEGPSRQNNRRTSSVVIPPAPRPEPALPRLNTLVNNVTTGDLSRARSFFSSIFTRSVPPRTLSAGLLDVSRGFQGCQFMNMPVAISSAEGATRSTNQAWWDTQRQGVNRQLCTPNLRTESPLAVTITNDADFTHTYTNATAMITTPDGRQMRRMDFARREFTAAFEHTSLYRFLNTCTSGRDLSTHFANVFAIAIPAQESSWGEGTTSRANARGTWQLVSVRGPANDPLDGVASHVKFRQVFGPSATRASIHPERLGEGARAFALHIDNVFNYLRQTLGEDSPVLQNPRDLLLPALIGSYHHGQGTEAAMLLSSLSVPRIQEIIRRANPEEIRENLYLEMSSEFYQKRIRTPPANRSRELQLYGPISVRYVPSALTLYSLITLKETYPNISIGRAIELQGQFPHVPLRFIVAALDPNTTIHTREGRQNYPPLTTSVRLPVAEVRAATSFVSPGTHSQDQSQVQAWLRGNDPIGQRYASGLANNIVLHRIIDQEVRTGWLWDTNARPRMTAVFNDSSSGVLERWRRVVRTDQLPVLTEIALALNETLYVAGMPRDRFIVPQINGAVRSIARNRQLNGSSRASAHLGFSALDFNINSYTVYELGAEGAVQAFSSDASLGTFSNALKIATARLARENHLFVRYHNAHFHVVPRVVSTTQQRRR